MLSIIDDARIGYNTDLLDKILKHLPLKDLAALSSTCKSSKVAIEQVFSEKCSATSRLYPSCRELLPRNRGDIDSLPAQIRVTKLDSSHIPKKWKLAEIAKELWLDSEALLPEDMIDKVNRVDVHLQIEGFKLCGVKADGDCFMNAFLESLKTLSIKIEHLDQQGNKIAYLRNVISEEYVKTSARGLPNERAEEIKKRAEEIKKDRKWIAASGEGDLLAKVLNIPIRIVTVSKDRWGCGINDMLVFPNAGHSNQVWESLSSEEKPQAYVLIINLQRHFIYAKKQLKTNIPPLLNMPLSEHHLPPVSKLSLLAIPEAPLRQFPLLSKQSPIRVMEYFYNIATTPEKKRACLCYLLYYQHYNAEFTEEEIRRLGYCSPLLAKQTKSGYIRTADERLFKLIEPWIKVHLKDFFRHCFFPANGNPLNLVKLSATSAISVLKIFFKEQIREVASLIPIKIKKKERICRDKKFIFVEITPSDLKKGAYDIVKERLLKEGICIDKTRKYHPNLCVIFLLQISNIDFRLMWGARLPPLKRCDFKLQYMALDSKEMFGEKKTDEMGVFSLLNEAGAVPDRLALNAFLTKELGNEDFASALKAIGLSILIKENYSPVHLLNTLAIWHRQIEEIDSYTVADDPGSELYRKAILQWHICFFEHYELTKFAAPLLHSQVSPWISNATGDKEIVQWAKAYQNLCEIVMFCLQTFPEKFSELNLESILLDCLQNERKLPPSIQTTIGLFPYAMTGFLHIFDHLLQRFEALQQPFIMTHLCHNYFETFNLVELLGTKSPLISSTKVDWIEDINEFPDVLIADIHPNNATKEILSQNNIAEWIQSALEENPSKTMILILDITLNHLSDPILQRTLKKLVPFIEKGQLEIFGIQSLAKLVQVGADNFSGGICLHLGNSSKNSNLNFPSPIPEKARFFSLMSHHFQHITTDYFEQVRSNTNLMYEILTEGFSNISEILYVEKNDGESDRIMQSFCAANITPNGDNKTVYVAINFKALISKLKITDIREKEKLISSFINLIVKLAELRGLPLATRQSFGFSLSNMSQTGETIRFSLGIENEKLLYRYADVVIDFTYALSIYVAKNPRQFDIKEFETNVEKIIKILESGEMDPITAPLCEETFNEHFDETLETVGNTEIHFKNHQFSLKISENNEDCLVCPMNLHPNIVIDGYSLQNPHSDSILMRFIFHVICLNTKPTHVTVQTCQGKNQYTIHGIFDGHFLSSDDNQIVDKNSKIKINFEPNFSLTLPNGNRLTSNQVFVNIQELNMGSVPVNLSKLNVQKRYLVFEKCIRHDFEVVPYEYEQSAFLLKLTKPKPSLDYLEKIKELFKNGLPAVVNFINDLNLEDLPVASDLSGKFQQEPLKRILGVLKKLGVHISHKLTEEIISQIIGIKSDDCKKAFLNGIAEGFLSDSLDVNKKLRPEIAKIFASLFSRKDLAIIVDDYIFDHWIKDLQEHIIACGDKLDKPRVCAYLIAFFPRLKWISLDEVDLSISIRDIGERTEFQPLLDHIAVLENSFLEKAKGVKEAQFLTNFLKVYVFYPLSDENKQTLLNNLAILPKELRKEWIYNPNFYYYPLDRADIHFAADDSDLICCEENKELLKIFFESIEGKTLILEDLNTRMENIVRTVFRWALMTQDKKLFKALQEYGESIGYSTKIIEKLQFYQQYLDKSDPIQLELINFINSLANKWEED
ncbi:F-box protein [Candidatus Protochlamydia sp. W-9]|uniref:F-box protein n=1 Tax=Candidatus Protochlamydia sp. W-9 TaxID=1785087 RepID=UPI00096A83C4|nr:F-box protein [Candidatus Protochlamydia sp. W-9]